MILQHTKSASSVADQNVDVELKARSVTRVFTSGDSADPSDKIKSAKLAQGSSGVAKLDRVYDPITQKQKSRRRSRHRGGLWNAPKRRVEGQHMKNLNYISDS